MKSIAYSMSAIRYGVFLKNGDITKRTNIMAPAYRFMTPNGALPDKLPLYDTRVDSYEKALDNHQCNATELLPSLSTRARKGLPPSCLASLQIIYSSNLNLGSSSKLLSQNKNDSSYHEISTKEQEILNDLLESEDNCSPNIDLLYSTNPEVEDKVDITMRNEAIANLKFVHDMFFGLSLETFAAAVSMIDRFVVKVKVKPKYMACVVVACYALASQLWESTENQPTLDDLVFISKCGGSSSDLKKMMVIVQCKLNNDLKGVTFMDFLRVFLDGRDVQPNVERLINIICCSGNFHYHRASCLALGLLTVPAPVLPYEKLLSLATFCQVNIAELNECVNFIKQSYEEYYGQHLPSTQDKLVWTLSKRTLANMSSSSPPLLPSVCETEET